MPSSAPAVLDANTATTSRQSGACPTICDGFKISVLQAFQLCVVFTLNFCNGGCQRNGIFAFLFVSKENPQRRSQKRPRNNDDGKHDKKRRAATQTGEGAYQLLDRLCRGFDQLFSRAAAAALVARLLLFWSIFRCASCVADFRARFAAVFDAGVFGCTFGVLICSVSIVRIETPRRGLSRGAGAWSSAFHGWRGLFHWWSLCRC